MPALFTGVWEGFRDLLLCSAQMSNPAIPCRDQTKLRISVSIEFYQHLNGNDGFYWRLLGTHQDENLPATQVVINVRQVT